MTRYVIGADPGQTTGLARLDLDTGAWELVQATPGAVLEVVSGLAPIGSLVALAIEQFVVGPRAARSATPAAGATTRELIGALTQLGTSLGAVVLLRTAAQVKPWASDKRLLAAGVRGVTGWGHGRDAARHAIYAAVSDLGFPDPLGRGGGR